MIFETICMLAGESKPVSLYSDKEDTEHFSCGYILGATQEDVVLCSITPNGLYDGFLVLKTANIFAVEYDDQYTQKIQALYTAREQKHPHLSFVENDNLMKNVLQYARDHSLVVSIELFDSQLDNIQGLVKEVDDEYLYVMQLDDSGCADGKICVLMEAVTSVSCDAEKENALNALRVQGLKS